MLYCILFQYFHLFTNLNHIFQCFMYWYLLMPFVYSISIFLYLSLSLLLSPLLFLCQPSVSCPWAISVQRTQGDQINLVQMKVEMPFRPLGVRPNPNLFPQQSPTRNCKEIVPLFNWGNYIFRSEAPDIESVFSIFTNLGAVMWTLNLDGKITLYIYLKFKKIVCE